MDLRHTDPRMGRGDHDLRVMPGQPAPTMPTAVMGMGMPPAMHPQQPVRPPQPIPDVDP